MKSKMRFQKLDQATKDRQQSWLDFKKGKGAKKKVSPFVPSISVLLVVEHVQSRFELEACNNALAP